MIFNEAAYFFLLAGAALAFRALPPAAKPWWLFLTGALFYAYFSPAFVLVLLVETVLVYALGYFVRRHPRTAAWAFALGLLLTLGMLVVYKYGGLLTATAHDAGTSLPDFEDLRLPLAISFFTFEFVHYLAEARKGTLPPHGLQDFLGFALFVPTMVAGPIKRFDGFFRQVSEAKATADDVSAGTTRILTGLVKKVVLADTLTLWVAPLASTEGVEIATRFELVAALVAYSLRIYLDFSGYSDIAIGSARLFGVRVPENFSWPYFKTNITEFWRSWHISLTSWIRDYVYVPLGGRRGTARQCLNLIAAFALSGMWHGAAWNFLGWGLYHGLLVAAHHVWAARALPRMPGKSARAVDERLGARGKSAWPRRAARMAGAVAGGIATFSLVTLGWGLFAMPFSRFMTMMGLLFGGGDW